MIGPSRDTKGGMTTVVNNYFEYGLENHVELKYIESINDKNLINKFLKEKKGFIEYLFNVKKYDIVHIHMASRRSTFRKIKYIKIAKKYNKKVILHIHGGGFKKFYDEECNLKKQKYIKKYLNYCDKVIVLSEEWKKYFEKLFAKEKITIVYNGVNIPKDYNKDINNKKILFLGRLVKEKGIYELIESIKDLTKEYKDIQLYIGGDGDLEKLKELVKEQKLENNIIFLGWIDTKTKEKYLKGCSFFILPSYFEAMPVSLLEAMAYKSIVIATNVGGIPQIITNNTNGILIKEKNNTAISNSIRILLNDSSRRKEFSENARKTIEKNFDILKTISEIVNIYNNW